MNTQRVSFLKGFTFGLSLFLPLAGCGGSDDLHGQPPPDATDTRSMDELIRRRHEIGQLHPTTVDEAVRTSREFLDLDARIGVKKGYWTKDDYEGYMHNKY
jgi:hypothetical protein